MKFPKPGQNTKNRTLNLGFIEENSFYGRPEGFLRENSSNYTLLKPIFTFKGLLKIKLNKYSP